MKYIRWIVAAVFIFSAGAGISSAGDPAAQNPSWKFVVLSDSRGTDNGVNTEILKILTKAVIDEKPKLVIFAGDLVTGGTVGMKGFKKQLTWWRTLFMEPLRNEGIDVYPVRGNHELFAPVMSKNNEAWREVFSGEYALPDNGPAGEKQLTYSFTYANAFFAGFDLYVKSSGQAMDMDWFKEQIAQNPRPFVFIFAHEPLFPLAGSGAHGQGAIKAHRNVFLKEFVAAGCVCYFCGHDHWYDHARAEVLPEKWLHQFTVGTGGAPLRHWEGKYIEKKVAGVCHSDKYGYMVVEINGNRADIIMKEYSDTGFKTIDTFNYTTGGN